MPIRGFELQSKKKAKGHAIIDKPEGVVRSILLRYRTGENSKSVSACKPHWVLVRLLCNDCISASSEDQRK